MELLEAVKTRKSIRAFKAEAVPQEVIQRILEASRSAAVNRRNSTARKYSWPPSLSFSRICTRRTPASSALAKTSRAGQQAQKASVMTT